MTVLDELSPRYIGEDRLKLSLGEEEAVLQAFRSIVVHVDYTATLPQSVVPPLVLEVSGPSVTSYHRRVFKRPPASFVFTPLEGGPHTVTFREAAHNRWWGNLKLQIDGEQLDRERPI